jgi:hypothetical protein
MISFVIYYLETNAPTNPLLTNSSYGLRDASSQLNQSLDIFKTKVANNISTTLGSSIPAPVAFVFLIFEAAFYIPRTIFTVMTAVPAMITGIIFPSLAATGLGVMMNILVGFIASIILLTIVLLSIKTIRSGESER